MTFQEFAILRRDELVVFFQERFGKSWRQIVARQHNLHPRFFWRWKSARPAVLCRRILKLEPWARAIGFRAITDEQMESKVQEHRAFRAAAQRQVDEAQEKRDGPAPATDELAGHEVMERIMAAVSGKPLPAKPN
ncbi:MAG: hypothetical protein WCQ21_28240 [Verrucomicrobiota bacterium]